MLIIFGALKIELSGIIKYAAARKIFRKNSTVIYKGKIDGTTTVIAVTGMGKDRALAAADIVSGISEIKKAETKKVLITGFCGAACRDLKAGDTVVYTNVKNLTADRVTGAGGYTLHYPDGLLEHNNLKTAVCGCTDNVITAPDEKTGLSKKYNVDVIDIETYSLIKAIKEKYPLYTPVYCIRTVSDDCETEIPDYFKNDKGSGMLINLFRSIILSFFSIRELNKNISSYRNIKIARKSLNSNLPVFARELI
jgi:purine-nucleoside phosphorylase